MRTNEFEGKKEAEVYLKKGNDEKLTWAGSQR